MITCFDIGGSAIKAATATRPESLNMLGRVPTPLHDFDLFCDALSALIETGGAPSDGVVAISVTGVVDPQSGLATVANIPCLNGRAVAADLGSRLKRPVVVANDADCFVLAEANAGAGRTHRVVFGAILGTGVGGGLVIDGQLLRGAGGLTGEWGHGTIVATDVSVPPFKVRRFACGCGREGCVDTVGGARGLERLHQLLHGASLDSRAIIDSWLTGNPAAAQTIDLFIELVAPPLALVVNVVGADIVPVGGGLGNCVPLIERLDAAVRGAILRHIDRPLVVPAQLTADAGLLGAAVLGLQEQMA